MAETIDLFDEEAGLAEDSTNRELENVAGEFLKDPELLVEFKLMLATEGIESCKKLADGIRKKLDAVARMEAFLSGKSCL